MQTATKPFVRCKFETTTRHAFADVGGPGYCKKCSAGLDRLLAVVMSDGK